MFTFYNLYVYYLRIMLSQLCLCPPLKKLIIETLGAITFFRADASRNEAVKFFNNKHIKCKHKGFFWFKYIEFMSCKPAITATYFEFQLALKSVACTSILCEF